MVLLPNCDPISLFFLVLEITTGSHSPLFLAQWVFPAPVQPIQSPPYCFFPPKPPSFPVAQGWLLFLLWTQGGLECLRCQISMALVYMKCWTLTTDASRNCEYPNDSSERIFIIS